MSAVEIANVAGEFNHGTLHPQAQAQKRDTLRAGVTDGRNFALDAALAETARNQHAVVTREQPLRPFGLDVLATNSADANLGPIRDARMVERFIDRFIGVVVLGVLTHER